MDGCPSQIPESQQAPQEAPDMSLPPVLRPQHFVDLQRQVHAECQPQGLMERLVVNDIARRAYQLDLLDQVAGAVQRETITGLLGMHATPEGGRAPSDDVVLAHALASGRLEKCHRQSLGNSRGFYRALDSLQELQRRRSQAAAEDLPTVDPRFATEVQCEQHLVKRFEAGRPGCSKCAARHGHWLENRKCWECAGCGSQSGIRSGTVMSRSPIPLTTWFAAIRWVLLRPAVSATDLTALLGVQRLTTVSSVQRRIHQALMEDNRSDRLAGLDEIYCEPAPL